MLRESVALALVGAVVTIVGAACDRSPNDPLGDSDGPTNTPPDQTETAPDLQTILDSLETTRPSWDDLKALAESLPPRSYPAFAKKINPLADKISLTSGYVQANLDYWDSLVTRFAPNISPALINIAPPHTDSVGNNLVYPLTSAEMDEKLRAFGAIALREKGQSRAVALINFYPPGETDTGARTAQEFRDWVDTKLVPEVEAQATAAELLKLEYYGPFPVELEVWMNLQSGLSSLSDGEKIGLAQYVIDKVAAAARPFFSGRLIAHSYHNYTQEQPIPYADSLNFTGFDEIHFSLFPGCDVSFTATYVDVQLAEYKKIIDRSGLPWVIGELGIFENLYAACDNGGSAFDSIEAELYRTVFDRLDAFTLTPAGVMVDDLFRTEAARTEVGAYFAGK